MVMKLDGVLADRDAWTTEGHCSIGRAMEVVGTRSAMLLLRESYYGTTRFDDFAQRVGITDAVASARLKDLVKAGLLEKSPYREPGQRTRYEYLLTEMGRDLLPAVIALMQWGDKHLQDDGGPLRLVDAATGSPVRVRLCGDSGAEVGIDEILVRVSPDSALANAHVGRGEGGAARR